MTTTCSSTGSSVWLHGKSNIALSLLPFVSLTCRLCHIRLQHTAAAPSAPASAPLVTSGFTSSCFCMCCTFLPCDSGAQKADEEAAKVYEEFVESFKGDEAPGSDGGVKAFVRGGVVAPGSRSHDATGACWRDWASCVCIEQCTSAQSAQRLTAACSNPQHTWLGPKRLCSAQQSTTWILYLRPASDQPQQLLGTAIDMSLCLPSCAMLRCWSLLKGPLHSGLLWRLRSSVLQLLHGLLSADPCICPCTPTGPHTDV